MASTPIAQAQEAEPGAVIAELQRANATLQQQLAERDVERNAALAREAALAEVLGVINANPGDVTPVFNTILEKAHGVCSAVVGSLILYDGDLIYAVATHGFPADVAERLRRPQPSLWGVSTRHLAGERVVVTQNLQASLKTNETARRFIEATGVKAHVSVALRRDDVVLGHITAYRLEPHPFSETEISLLENFAAQAVIAMENARLLNEQREALERQMAIAEVLHVISTCAGNLQPVFDAIRERAFRLCDAEFGGIMLAGDNRFSATALKGLPPAYLEYCQSSSDYGTGSVSIRLKSGEIVHVDDMMTDEGYRSGQPSTRALVDLGGARSFLGVPLQRDNQIFGAITIYRQEVRPFNARQADLLREFAAQAMIAIENARLLGELRERTEALAARNSEYGERIEQQAATIDVLKVMAASPGDPQPVFDLIAQRARTFCNSDVASVCLVDGGMLTLKANAGNSADRALRYARRFPRPIDESSAFGRVIMIGHAIVLADSVADPRHFAHDDHGNHVRGVAAVPMLRAGNPIGAISLGREAPGEFSAVQMELLQTFAEQAVIAISSAETYRELQDRTAALAQRNTEFGERIEQQSATIDVLKVMSSSPGDPQPVFDLITQRARDFCGADGARLMEFHNELLHFRSMARSGPLTDADRKVIAEYPMAARPDSVIGRTILERQLVHIRDTETEIDMTPTLRALNRRSVAGIPLLRDGRPIGSITISKPEAGGFSDNQIELLQIFAEQAVIAISSAENHRALRTRTEELTRSVAELQALEETIRAVNSSLDLDIVLATIISRAVQLSQADEGTIYEYDAAADVFIPKAAHGMSAERVEALRQRRVRMGETHLGRSAVERRAVHVSDVQQDRAVAGDVADFLQGIHAVLAVPLLRDDTVIGGLVIRRRTAGDFGPSISTLLQTFAGQSVLAIENARLFQQLAERGEEASRARTVAEAALSDLRRTQDRLVQTEKMASLGQLTAGIAHEIKNPLNFVNNFSDLSVDLLDELNAAVAPGRIAMAEDMRAEIHEITDMLQGNLRKIAEHGRRADSIVKNMLLHSRAGASERREAELNTVAEEALNLAYHGARAETPGFNITMEKDFDPDVGMVELFPQEISRVMVNLINNGFYAAHKRAEQGNKPGFEPNLRLSTKNLGDQVEIRVRDNGTGIPPEVRDKIFEPFFTTKPAGQGTGLGLSLSFDIVVKQHGGQLSVESEPGVFTEFTITLPRQLPAAEGGKS